MINQEKVLRMTKMASYEEHGGRKDRAVVGYFRSDYIGKQTIISLIVITAAFLAGLGAYLVFHFSEVMGNIYSMDLVGTCLLYTSRFWSTMKDSAARDSIRLRSRA